MQWEFAQTLNMLSFLFIIGDCEEASGKYILYFNEIFEN